MKCRKTNFFALPGAAGRYTYNITQMERNQRNEYVYCLPRPCLVRMNISRYVNFMVRWSLNKLNKLS